MEQLQVANDYLTFWKFGISKLETKPDVIFHALCKLYVILWCVEKFFLNLLPGKQKFQPQLKLQKWLVNKVGILLMSPKVYSNFSDMQY